MLKSNYDPKLKIEVLNELVKKEKGSGDIAKQFKIPISTVCTWKSKAGLKSSQGQVIGIRKPKGDSDELLRLKKSNKTLRALLELLLQEI